MNRPPSWPSKLLLAAPLQDHARETMSLNGRLKRQRNES